jgi:P27 family predicted phage terminase small subunit
MNKLTTAEKKKRKTLKTKGKDNSISAGALSELPPVPAGLSDVGKKAFTQAAEDLLQRQVLRQADVELLELYATAVQTAAEAQNELKSGILYSDKNKIMRRNPAWTVWRSAAETARQLASRLTLTPYDRARTPDPQQEEQTGKIDGMDRVMALKHYRKEKTLPKWFKDKYNLDPLLGLSHDPEADRREMEEILSI